MIWLILELERLGGLDGERKDVVDENFDTHTDQD